MLSLAPLVALVFASLPAHAQDEAPAEAAAEEEAAEEEAAPAGPVTYTLDPGSSHLTVVIFNDDDRWTPVTGHDHAIEPTTFTGTVTWSQSDASACKVDISFKATDLRIDPPGARARAGIDPDGSIGDNQKETVVGNMLGKHQLEADKFPTISYSASKCGGTEGTVDVTGTLTLHGQSKTFTLPMKVDVSDSSFAAKGKATLSHGDFGMKPFTYGPATPKNQEKLVFLVDVKGSAK
jgi:polyisoprenoid-binding protein YceI